MKWLGGGTLFIAALTSCSIPSTPPRSTIGGYDFCVTIADAAQKISAWFGTLAWLLAIVVLVCLVLGNLIGNNWDGGAKAWYHRGRGLLVSGLGLSVVPFAYYCFSRANAAATATAATNLAMKAETAELAYDECIDAKSAWIASRTDSNGIGLTALKQAESAKAQAASAERRTEVTKATSENNRVAISEALTSVQKLAEAQEVGDKDNSGTRRKALEEAREHVDRASARLQVPIVVDAGPDGRK